jgi:magnesium transporter
MGIFMEKTSSKRSKKSGLAPGSLVHVGEQKVEKIRITVIDFDGDRFLEKEVQSVEECFPFRETSTVTWINVDGVHDGAVVEKLGSYFGLHPLILEDIMNTSQRPKMEDLGDVIYIVLRMIEFGNDSPEVTTEQMSLVFGRNFVISFQERPGDTFDPVRERIRRGKGRVRKMGPDYLAYALIDAVVDDYFLVLEKQGEEIECLEDELVANPRQETLHGLYALKRDMIFVRDVYDHTIQVIDNIETFREMLSGMLDTYLSSLSNRMNEVMKTLTIIATIFIPLTFLAGVYGMNFKFMPELNWRWGYFLTWGVMLAVGVFMVFYFKRKKWF